MKINQIAILFLIVAFGCKPAKTESDPNPDESNFNMDTIQNQPLTTLEKKEIFFYSVKDSINTNFKDAYISKENEVILFRPTEQNFGQLLEDTQSEALVSIDANFEELGNAISDTFKNNEQFSITICEKSFVIIPQDKDSLFLDTSKYRYGLIICKEDNRPIFKKANEKNLIQQIKNIYNL